jgi:Holliday junction resolvase
MVSNYVRGRAREYRVKKMLLDTGAIYVVRSYGSHSMFDLTAVFPNQVKLIQVKKDRISKEEKESLVRFSKKVRNPMISVEVWFTYPKLRIWKIKYRT